MTLDNLNHEDPDRPKYHPRTLLADLLTGAFPREDKITLIDT